MPRGLRQAGAFHAFRLLPVAALVVIAVNTVVIGLIRLGRVEVTPHGIDHTLGGVSNALLYGSLALCAVCALVVAGSAVRRRRWGAVASWLGLLVLIAGAPMVAILLYYAGGGTGVEGSSSQPQMGIFLDGVLCYLALPAIAAVAAFRLGSPPLWPVWWEE